MPLLLATALYAAAWCICPLSHLAAAGPALPASMLLPLLLCRLLPPLRLLR